MTDSISEEFFLEIIDRHKSQIHRICWGFSKNTEDIKDLYQDVVVNIWQGHKKFRNHSSYSTWIHRITINTCLLWKKKKNSFRHAKEVGTFVDHLEYQKLALEEDPKLISLKQGINELKAVDKTVILLVLEELSYKEISEITGLSISNIGVKINRIKARLKKQLNKTQ